MHSTAHQVFPDRMHFGRIFYNQARLAPFHPVSGLISALISESATGVFPSGTDVQEGLATGHGLAPDSVS